MIGNSHGPKPLLREKHFSGLQTQLRETGICFCVWIGPNDRECKLADIEEVDPQFTKRPWTKVLVNPRTPSLETLEAFFKNEQPRYCPGEHVNVAYAWADDRRRRSYERRWAVEIEPEEIWEGQHLVAVAFGHHSPKPVGYFSFKIKIACDRKEQTADVRIEPVLVYVSPRHRSKGYGIDLSIACAWICEDVLEATYRAVPAGTTISGVVYADYESKGGEKIGQFIHDCVTVEIDFLRGLGRRRSVELVHFELDAGY